MGIKRLSSCGIHRRRDPPRCSFRSGCAFRLPLFLRKGPFLLLRPETIAYERAVRLCTQNGFAPNIRLQLDQLATAYRSCGAGLSVTLLSDTVVHMSDHDEPVVFTNWTPMM